MSCRRVRDWLHRDASSLDEAQRLLLDDHLASCERCRGDRQRMQLVRRLGTGVSVPPAASREYGRAISRALLERDPAAPVRTRVPRRLVPLAIGGLAAVMAIALVVGGAGRGPANVAPAQTAASSGTASSGTASSGTALSGTASSGAASSGTAASGAASPGAALPGAPARGRQAADAVGVVEEGTLIAHGAALSRGAELPAQVPLHARGPARVRVASMQVAIAASAELRWVPGERAVVLDRGQLEIESFGAGPARVVTERFEIELDDAAVVVDPGTVRVQRGTARIFDRSREPLAQLSAGASWKAPESPRGSPRATPSPPSSRLPAGAAPAGGASHAAGASPGAGATPTDEAEAAMALAEAAQSRGDLDRAVSGYLAVATGFADRPVAESALYAAARIELRRVRTAAARELLVRYLDRYPQGRYAEDVRRELTRLP